MPINETAINAALAGALSAYHLDATPEHTRAATGAKRCDAQIRHKHGDRYYTALECKIGQNETQRKAAVKDAQRWLKQSACWNAVALCYPPDLAEPKENALGQRLESVEDLLMVRVDQEGLTGRWHKGGLADLAKLADDIGANETYAITDTLKHAITVASEQIDAHTGQALAVILELPWDPGNKKSIDLRPARIACLIIANMSLLHNRMRSEGTGIPHLESLIEIRGAPNRQRVLLENWRRVRDVDYAPVVDPALADVQHDQNGWFCGTPSEWETASLMIAPNLTINNFFFEEGKGRFLSTMDFIKVTYSAINRENKSYAFTAQFAGLDKNESLTFAMSASPSFDMVGPGTKTVSASVYLMGPVFSLTTKICAIFAAGVR